MAAKAPASNEFLRRASRTQRGASLRAGVRVAIALVVALALAACTVVRPLPARGPGSDALAVRQAAGLAAGDDVIIVPRQGRPFTMQVTSTDALAIEGTVDGTPRRVELESIDSLAHRSLSHPRTWMLVIGVVGLIALGQYAQGVSALVNP
jgi:hypothetical protein